MSENQRVQAANVSDPDEEGRAERGGEKGGGGGGLPEPQPGRRDRAGRWGRVARSIHGWVQLWGKVQVFLFSSEPRNPGTLKEVKRAPKKEQGLTYFAFPVAARCLPRQLLPKRSRPELIPPGPRGAGGGGGRHWGSSRRSLKAQAERQERFSLKSWLLLH